MKHAFATLVAKVAAWKTWQKVTAIIAMFVVAAGLMGVIFVYSALGQIKQTKKVDINSLSCVDLDGYVNIALLGVDSRSMSKKNLSGHNTDCIIVASINTETYEVNLISVFRDTYTRINGTETYAKINSAYASGGAEGAMKTLNQMMDLNIENYVMFNFKMVADLVNDVDGIEVNVKDYEIDELNKYTKQTAHNIGQKKYKLVKKPGKQTLEGVQAVSYGRIRKGVGDDFKRTSRMRTVIRKVTAKMQEMSMTKKLKIVNDLLPQVETSLSTNDIIGLAQRINKYEFNKSIGFPYNKTTGTLNGLSYVFPVDLAANVDKLHKEAFGQEDYEVSETVNLISAQAAAAVNSAGRDRSIDSSGRYQKKPSSKQDGAGSSSGGGSGGNGGGSDTGGGGSGGGSSSGGDTGGGSDTGGGDAGGGSSSGGDTGGGSDTGGGDAGGEPSGDE